MAWERYADRANLQSRHQKKQQHACELCAESSTLERDDAIAIRVERFGGLQDNRSITSCQINIRFGEIQPTMQQPLQGS